jgi:hypothetical protein
MVLKNQVILGTVNADAAAIQHISTFVDRWPAALDTVISGRYPLDAYKDLLLLGQGCDINNVLSFEPE